jgi:hypothetical protein
MWQRGGYRRPRLAPSRCASRFRRGSVTVFARRAAASLPFARRNHESYGLDHELGFLAGNEVTGATDVHQNAVRRASGESGSVAGEVRIQHDQGTISQRRVKELRRVSSKVQILLCDRRGRCFGAERVLEDQANYLARQSEGVRKDYEASRASFRTARRARGSARSRAAAGARWPASRRSEPRRPGAHRFVPDRRGHRRRRASRRRHLLAWASSLRSGATRSAHPSPG